MVVREGLWSAISRECIDERGNHGGERAVSKRGGDAAAADGRRGGRRSAREIYSDPVMKKFIDVATETVFGALGRGPASTSRPAR